MAMFRVRWEVDVDADNPKAAAALALDMQHKPDSTALVFDVLPFDWASHAPDPRSTRIDLLEDTV